MKRTNVLLSAFCFLLMPAVSLHAEEKPKQPLQWSTFKDARCGLSLETPYDLKTDIKNSDRWGGSWSGPLYTGFQLTVSAELESYPHTPERILAYFVDLNDDRVLKKEKIAIGPPGTTALKIAATSGRDDRWTYREIIACRGLVTWRVLCNYHPSNSKYWSDVAARVIDSFTIDPNTPLPDTQTPTTPISQTDPLGPVFAWTTFNDPEHGFSVETPYPMGSIRDPKSWNLLMFTVADEPAVFRVTVEKITKAYQRTPEAALAHDFPCGPHQTQRTEKVVLGPSGVHGLIATTSGSGRKAKNDVELIACQNGIIWCFSGIYPSGQKVWAKAFDRALKSIRIEVTPRWQTIQDKEFRFSFESPHALIRDLRPEKDPKNGSSLTLGTPKIFDPFFVYLQVVHDPPGFLQTFIGDLTDRLFSWIRGEKVKTTDLSISGFPAQEECITFTDKKEGEMKMRRFKFHRGQEYFGLALMYAVSQENEVTATRVLESFKAEH